MKLILIRHGSTDYNLKKRYCGRTDIGLNSIGRQQARKIRKKLKCLKIDKVICSGLKRTKQTARIIFAKRRPALVINNNLREIDFGDWEGLNYKEALKRDPLIYHKWLKNPYGVDMPNGERMRHFVTRIKKELKKIIRQNKDKAVAVVGHLGAIRVILNTVLGVRKKDFWKLQIKPRGIHSIEING